MKKAERERVKNLAAKRWHAKTKGDISLAELFSGADYAGMYDHYESAFIAGYLAGQQSVAQRKEKRRT